MRESPMEILTPKHHEFIMAFELCDLISSPALIYRKMENFPYEMFWARVSRR
jgi:hypothetical protein